jgi:hypothetical protein
MAIQDPGMCCEGNIRVRILVAKYVHEQDALLCHSNALTAPRGVKYACVELYVAGSW